MFACEYCEIFKGIYFKEHLRTNASELSVKIYEATSFSWKNKKYLLPFWVKELYGFLENDQFVFIVFI